MVGKAVVPTAKPYCINVLSFTVQSNVSFKEPLHRITTIIPTASTNIFSIFIRGLSQV
jgi:hypothetical protein